MIHVTLYKNLNGYISHQPHPDREIGSEEY